MLRRRNRTLGGMLGYAGEVQYFTIAPGNEALKRALTVAKLGEGNTALARQIKAIFLRYLEDWFAGWEVTVPRGSGATSFMYRLFKDHPRFVPCFRHTVPVGVRHDWRARLAHYPRQEVVGEVAGRWIVVVDDFVTTGTTLTAHLVPLLIAGANATGLALAGR